MRLAPTSLATFALTALLASGCGTGDTNATSRAGTAPTSMPTSSAASEGSRATVDAEPGTTAARMPEDFPADAPIPASFELTGVPPAPDGFWSLDGTVDAATWQATVDDAASLLEAGGWQVTSRATEGETHFGAGVLAKLGDRTYALQVSGHPGDGRLEVHITTGETREVSG